MTVATPYWLVQTPMFRVAQQFNFHSDRGGTVLGANVRIQYPKFSLRKLQTTGVGEICHHPSGKPLMAVEAELLA